MTIFTFEKLQPIPVSGQFRERLERAETSSWPQVGNLQPQSHEGPNKSLLEVNPASPLSLLQRSYLSSGGSMLLG